MTNCDYCDEELFDTYGSGVKLSDGNYVHLCDDCRERFEQTDGVSGKFVADRCKECGHLKGIHFTKYKPRGRPKGSKTDPVKLAERRGIRPLDLAIADSQIEKVA